MKDFSTTYLSYKDEAGMPVVLARGLWSNLYTWKDFGEELSDKLNHLTIFKK